MIELWSIVLAVASWLIVCTHPAISCHYRRLFDAIGRFVGKLVLMLFVLVWLLESWSWAVFHLVVGSVGIVLWWRFTATFIRQMNATKEDTAHELVVDSGLAPDCLTHFELGFYIRNRRMLESNYSDAYSVALRQMKRHLDQCRRCRLTLDRDEGLMHRYIDPEES